MRDLLDSIGKPIVDWFVEHMGKILIGSGLLLLLLSIAIRAREKIFAKETLLELGVALGTALLSGGLFAWLTKTAQLRGVFRKDLESVIYSRDHALLRKDAEKLWAGVTRALHNDSFRGIEDKLYKAIQSTYLPVNKDFYYKDAERKMFIRLIDRDKRIVEIEIEFTALLVPDRSKQSFTRPYKFQIDDKYNELGMPEISCSHVNVESGEVLNEETAKPTEGDASRLQCNVSGSTERNVRVKDHIKFRQCLLRDSVIVWKAASYVDRFKIEVHYSPDDLILQHSPIGSIELKEEAHRRNGLLTISTEDLIFAGLGVMITLQVNEDLQNEH